MPTKPINIKPLTGIMDTRSTPDELAMGDWRYVLNVGVTGKNKLCRSSGWDKYLTKSDYNNEDLHDQLLSLTGQVSRKPITMLFEAESTRKSIKLIAGTERVLFAFNPATGNWKTISDQLGAAGARWRRPAQVGDTVIFTNNLDEPVYWNFDQAPGAGDQSVAVIPELSETFKITKVGTVITWKGCVFLMNIVEDGSVRTYRIVWSDFNNGLSYTPGGGSIAGRADLDPDETILAALPLRDILLVYTNKGIWEGTVGSGVSDGPVFSFVKRYNPDKTGENCLYYPNSLITIGDEHFFAGIDGLYTYSFFVEKPKLVPWMHKASLIMFDNLNKTDCNSVIAAYNSFRKEVFVSYAKGEQTIPSETLVFNTEFPFAYVLDYGFSAMLTHNPRINVLSIRDFLIDQCLCGSAENLDDTFGGFVKEGQYCTPQTDVVCDPPGSIFTTVGLDVGDGVVTEDYTQSEASAGSLCERLEGLTLQGLCEAELRADECNTNLRFVVASSTDYCIKQLSDNYYREECTNFSGCGTYLKKGYKSILRSGPLAFSEMRDDKEIHRFEAEVFPVEQTKPSQMALRIGVSAQARDPNLDSCGIVWVAEDAKDLECLSGSTEAQHLADNTRPDETLEWPVYYIGRYLYFEMTIQNPGVTPADTGGACCLSRITLDVNKTANKNG